MEFTILKVFEQNDVLRVEVETAYGKMNLGLNIEQKYLDPITQQPKYLAEVKDLLEKKYNPVQVTETPVADGNEGQTFNTDNL